MATVPVPSVNTPTYASWGAAVATKLNTTAQLYRAADVSMSVSNGVWTTALPAAVGPCIVTVQGTMTLERRRSIRNRPAQGRDLDRPDGPGFVRWRSVLPDLPDDANRHSGRSRLRRVDAWQRRDRRDGHDDHLCGRPLPRRRCTDPRPHLTQEKKPCPTAPSTDA